MMGLFKEIGYRNVLVIGIDVSKNKFTATAVNGMYENKMKTRDINLNKENSDKLYKELDRIVEKEGI